MNKAKDRNNRTLMPGQTVMIAALILSIGANNEAGTAESPKNLHVRAVGNPREYVPEFEINSTCVELVRDGGTPLEENKAWQKAIADVLRIYRKDIAKAEQIEPEINANLSKHAEDISESAFRESEERKLASLRLWEACDLTGDAKIVKIREAILWLTADSEEIG